MFYRPWYKYVLYKYALSTCIVSIKLGSSVSFPTQHVFSSMKMSQPPPQSVVCAFPANAYIV